MNKDGKFCNAAVLKEMYKMLSISGDESSFIITAVNENKDRDSNAYMLLNRENIDEDLTSLTDSTILGIAKMAYECGFSVLDAFNLLNVAVHNAINDVYEGDDYPAQEVYFNDEDYDNFDDFSDFSDLDNSEEHFYS